MDNFYFILDASKKVPEHPKFSKFIPSILKQHSDSSSINEMCPFLKVWYDVNSVKK